jgi:hypothetical protein
MFANRTVPLNADFDGDEINLFLTPDPDPWCQYYPHPDASEQLPLQHRRRRLAPELILCRFPKEIGAIVCDYEGCTQVRLIPRHQHYRWVLIKSVVMFVHSATPHMDRNTKDDVHRENSPIDDKSDPPSPSMPPLSPAGKVAGHWDWDFPEWWYDEVPSIWRPRKFEAELLLDSTTVPLYGARRSSVRMAGSDLAPRH